MEELGVQPGDFVTYYARARDVKRGRRATEARSDIFFLEVKPFEEEFVAAQSQPMGQGGGRQSAACEGLAEAQKEIIVATWKLDARARRARDAQLDSRTSRRCRRRRPNCATRASRRRRRSLARWAIPRGAAGARPPRATIRSAARSKRWAAPSASSTS